MKINMYREIKQYLGITFGALMLAISYSWFLVPYKIAPGGVGGIAEIMYHLFHIPIGITMIFFNVPLFFLGYLMLGKTFGIRSIYGMFSSSILTDLVSFQTLHKLGIIKNLGRFSFIDNGHKIYAILSPSDIYLSAIAGSVILGLGLGIIFKFRGSTGGTDIPVAIIKQKLGISIGTGYWFVETLIILSVGVFFHDIKLILWGYINLFISSKVTDFASEGLPYVKGVYIITDFPNDVRNEIYKTLERGVTFIKSEGGYTGTQRDMIFVILNRRQVSILRDIMLDLDPKAFMIVTDVYDVLGYGFTTRSIDFTAPN